jgi:hypothetical protein
MDLKLKNKLFYDLIRFSYSRNSSVEKIKYLFLGCIFYPFLVQFLSSSATKESDASTSSQAGEDIYPLF